MTDEELQIERERLVLEREKHRLDFARFVVGGVVVAGLALAGSWYFSSLGLHQQSVDSERELVGSLIGNLFEHPLERRLSILDGAIQLAKREEVRGPLETLRAKLVQELDDKAAEQRAAEEADEAAAAAEEARRAIAAAQEESERRAAEELARLRERERQAAEAEKRRAAEAVAEREREAQAIKRSIDEQLRRLHRPFGF